MKKCLLGCAAPRKKTGVASLFVDVWRDDRFAQRRLSIAVLAGRAGGTSANRVNTGSYDMAHEEVAQKTVCQSKMESPVTVQSTADGHRQVPQCRLLLLRQAAN